MRRWLTRGEEETRALGRELARELAPDGVLLLSGELRLARAGEHREIVETEDFQDDSR